MKAFRTLSLVEGVSLLILLFIAMPAKYQFGLDQAVFYAGITHGILFLAYLVATLAVSHSQGWSIIRWLMVFLAGVIPFGFIFVDRQLKNVPQPPIDTDATSPKTA